VPNQQVTDPDSNQGKHNNRRCNKWFS